MLKDGLKYGISVRGLFETSLHLPKQMIPTSGIEANHNLTEVEIHAIRGRLFVDFPKELLCSVPVTHMIPVVLS